MKPCKKCTKPYTGRCKPCKAVYDTKRRQSEAYKLKRKEVRRRYNSSEKGKANTHKQNIKRVSTLAGLIASRIRAQINMRLLGRYKAGFRDLPYSPEELSRYLESKFQPGMSWENRSEWHVDHIIPLKYKNQDGTYYWNQEELADPKSETFKKAWSLENLQPLWAEANIRKSNKLVG